MNETPEDQALERRMVDTVAEVVKGTPWAPTEGAILTECVVVMGWYHPDGSYGTSHLRCGSPWGTRGLLEGAVADVDAREQAEFDDHWHNDREDP